MLSLIFILSIHSIVFSQTCDDLNLVKNGDFEDKTKDDFFCGTFFCADNCSNMDGCCCCDRDLCISNPYLRFVNDWQRVSNHFATPDYFNSCAQPYTINNATESASVPDNTAGNQGARSGSAYGGIIGRQPFTNYTEYLQVPLRSALSAGATYEARMYVSLGEESKYACAGLSMLFTNGALDGGGSSDIITGYTPQVTSNSVISDMQNWILISGQFVAQGGENYLTIGVFNSTISTPVSVNPSGRFSEAYYYIDDVVLMQPGLNSCCPDHKLFQNTNQLPNLTIMNNYIKAGNNVDPNYIQGPVVVQNGQNVTFQAGNQIILDPGFSTHPGAIFNAVIKPCTNIELCPVSISAFVPNAWVGCPGIDNFCIPTQGAEQWSFEVYARWGNSNDPSTYADQGYSNSGTINGYYTCVWDGLINGGVPNTAVFVYILRLNASCVDEYEQHDNISFFNSCRMMNTASNSDTINNSRYDIPLYISPNPSSGKFEIKMFNSELMKEQSSNLFNITVRNILGETIYNSQQTISSSVTIDLSSHPKGIYFIKVQSGENIYTEKLILQ